MRETAILEGDTETVALPHDGGRDTAPAIDRDRFSAPINRRLATALFSGAGLTGDQEAMLGYMVDSGAYGTMAHSVGNQIARYGRIGYFVRRAFPPLSTMAMLYPVLGRVPVLLPACWVWRLASAVATKPKKVGYQLRTVFRKNL